MQQASQTTAASATSLPDVLSQLEHCLRKGCFFCLEHAQHNHYTHGRWTLWSKPSCYNGNLSEIHSEIERCRERNKDKLIRLKIEDFSFRSRFTVMVHNPAANEV